MLPGLFSLAAVNSAERKILEEQLVELERQIVTMEGIISGYRQQGSTLSREIKKLESEIAKTNLEIKAIELSIKKLDQEIVVNEGRVLITNNKLKDQKIALRLALQNIYEQEAESLAEVLLKSVTISEFFNDVNSLLELQQSLRSTLEKTLGLRDQLVEESEQLAQEKADAASLKLYQDSMKKGLQGRQVDKKKLLQVTKGEESKYQELLKTTRKTAAEIRNRIFEFLGGGQLTFGQAYQLAKQASDLTGVRPALILAVLYRESALGQNVGRCKYREAMHPTRDVPLFLQLTNELGIDPESVTVSCPNRDGIYGGAMGPAQFIASTWNIYKNAVADLTGSNPASPWRNLDAFVGTALYLKDARDSKSCVSYSQEIPNQATTLRDRCAAARYYAGNRWYNYRWTYGERVIKKAEQFEDDILNITS